ncbi:hypothetical protein K7432_016518 [Basidiobolus ranarum]|uniref:NAD-dependent epimerase/dehydratase domain-containing protein n=1 Tax=Basidiobolus ranarum TaxID=34480 RepID=A0ABR2VML4_9FUNG
MLANDSRKDYVLVTGGAGYIGSHTCLALLKAGFQGVVGDNLSNSSEEAILRIRKLSGKDLEFRKVDVGDETSLNAVFDEFPGIWAVIHFAGLKAVGESSEIPLRYYQNNISAPLPLSTVTHL